MATISLDASRTALLVMDLQADIVAQYGDACAPLLERTATLIAAARAAQVPIIYIVVGFRPGYPEASPRNPIFGRLATTGRFMTTTPGADIAPAVQPRPEDIIIVKHRVSAFSGTDLEMILRARGIETLVLTGLATSGVVLSTVVCGFDADYRLVVVTDCCADSDQEVHRVLVEKYFARRGSVAHAEEIAFQR
jgi:nicotinamidase-related amidase